MKRLALLALCVAGCTEARTEVIVVVNKYGITIGKDIDGLQLIVKNHPTDDPIYESDKHPLCPDNGPPITGCWTLPVTATLVPGPGNPDDKVIVQVLGLRGGAQKIGDEATFSFLKHVSQRLDFVLYGNCLDVDCTTQDAACNYNGECEQIMPTSFNGEPNFDGPPPGLPDLGGAGGDLAGVDLMTPIDMHVTGDMAMSLGDMRSGDLAMMSSMDLAMSMSLDMTLIPTWSPQTSTTASRLRAIWGWSANNLVAVGDSGTILYTTNGGTSWSPAPSPGTGADLYSVWGTTIGNLIFAVGNGGAIVMSTDGGVSWTPSGNPWSIPPIDLRGVWGDTESNLFWAVGNGNTLGFWNGVTWNNVCGGISNDASNSYHGVWGSGSTSSFFVAGVAGTGGLFALEDPLTVCGMNPSNSPSSSPAFDLSCSNTCPSPLSVPGGSAPLNALSGNAGSEYTVGLGGEALLCSTSSCSNDNNGAAVDLNSIWVRSSIAEAYAVGPGGVILRRDAGLGWQQEATGATTLNGVWGDEATGIAWAVGDGGKILKRQ